MPPSFAEAIHLVSSPAAMGCVKQAGGRGMRVHHSWDELTSGPCDVDPVRHEELRRTWQTEGCSWKWHLGLEDLRAAIAGDDPVVLWGTRAFSDLVWLWWTLHGLGLVGAGGPRFFLARPHPEDPLTAVGGSTPDDARIALASSQPISNDEWREGAELWIKFAAPSPLAFDEARRTGSRVFPELTMSAELHGAWFPRLKDRRLQVSELDEVLLGAFDDSWRTTSELISTLPPDRLARLVWPFDPSSPSTVFARGRCRACWSARLSPMRIPTLRIGFARPLGLKRC